MISSSSLILLGSSLGFSLSALNIYLLSSIPFINKRRVRKSFPNYSEVSNESDNPEENEEWTNTDAFKYIERDIRDPSPTVSVPYKIISRRFENYKEKSYPIKNETESDNLQYTRDDKDIYNEKITDDWAISDLEQW